MTWNEKIRHLRKQNGWSQQELADRAGYTHKSAIARIEKGQRGLTRIKIKEFADIFGVSPAYIIDDDYEFNSKKEALIEMINAIDDEATLTMINSILDSILQNRDK